MFGEYSPIILIIGLIIFLYIFGFFLTFVIILFLFVYFIFKIYKAYTRNKWRFFPESIESFASLSDTIQMYVISLKNPTRLQNIKKQENNIQHLIQIFDGVDGNKLTSQDTHELFKSRFLDEKYKDASGTDLRVIGCYLSHLNLLKKIMNDESPEFPKKGYTLIFEDDFNILSPASFIDDVRALLNKVPEFDLLFLGNLNNNKGEQVIDTIYKIDRSVPLWGTHAYIVNNKNIKKIIYHVQRMDRPIDIMYESLGNAGKLNVFVVHPTLVNQQPAELPSTII